MISLPIGLFLMIGVVAFSVDPESWPLFLNYHAIVVVIVGTLAALVLANPVGVLKNLVSALWELRKRSRAFEEYWSEFDQLSASKTLVEKSDCVLINAAVGYWESGISSDMFIVLLSQKHKELEGSHLDGVLALRSLAKYPPALGMIGTVVGLVGLFANLGTVNKSGLGPSLALAMTATFFGLILANALITPLADRLHVQHVWQRRFYTEIYQVLLLINRGESLALVDQGRTGEKLAA